MKVSKASKAIVFSRRVPKVGRHGLAFVQAGRATAVFTFWTASGVGSFFGAVSYSLQFLVFTVAGRLNRQQQDLIEYLREENRILREHLGSRCLRLTDDQRRRLWRSRQGARTRGSLGKSRHLIHDRDPLDTKTFGKVLRGGGVEPLRLPARSPNLNAYAERFVRSIKDECLSRAVLGSVPNAVEKGEMA